MILARPYSSLSMALTPQAAAQGRSLLTMARIGAGLGAAAALDALGLVDLGAAVDDGLTALDRADHRAGVGQAVAAQVGDGVAGLLGQALQAKEMTLMSGGS